MDAHDVDRINYDERRSLLVATLWKLKQELTKLDSSVYIDFSLMMRDDSYRSKVLDKAIHSEVFEIQEIAHYAKQLNFPGKLVDRKDISDHPELEDIALAQLHSPPAHTTGPRYFFGFGISALLIVLVGSVTGYFVSMNKGNNLIPEGVVEITDNLLQDTLWTQSNTYYLNKVIFVEGSAKLTIEPGTKILGKPGSALIVTRDASIYARGKADAPILFSSAAPVGKRKSGDWGGVVLLGSAPVNRANPHIEGIDENDFRGHFGGSDPSSNCGVLEFVRIEFAGYEVYANNELNGLTLGGCGNNTVIRQVQVHLALDDGIEVFGGTVFLDHILITGAGDDGFDWDMGWQGGTQFLVVQQYIGRGDNGFEGDNNKKKRDAEPRSMPTFSNVTLIGARQADKKQRAMTLREGSGGQFINFIVTGFTGELIDMRDPETVALTKTGELRLQSLLVDKVGPGGIYYPVEPAGKEDDDQGFDEKAYLNAPERRLVLANPELINPFDVSNPAFQPLPSSPASQQVSTIPEGEFWDEAATFLGAIRPGVKVSWLSGWTAYPEQ